MAFVALYDANVLYPNTLRDLLVRVGLAGLVQAKWTDEILDEVFRNLKEDRPDLDQQRLDRTRNRMLAVVPDCLVKGYEPLVPALELPDPDDRHVLAAAIRARAQVIVTFNLKDFPAGKLAAWDVEAKHPDAFVEDQIDLDSATVFSCVQQIADSKTDPPWTVDDALERLHRSGLVAAVAALRALHM